MRNHTLLEGFLLRLARSRDADACALRGGMLVRSWARDARRVGDIDLVCRARPDLRAILALDAGDGVVFDRERFRVDASETGLTLFASGEVDGRVGEITVDLEFGLDVWPQARRAVLALPRGDARVWACPHPLLIATKLRVLAELGPRRWRPKDLADVWTMLQRFPVDGSVHEAIERAGAPRTVLPWSHEAYSQARWRRYDGRELDVVVGQIREAL